MKYFISLCCTYFIISCCQAQTLTSHRDKIEEAKLKIVPALEEFNTCITKTELDNCITALVKNAQTSYEKYLVGGRLFTIDSLKSFQLHKEAYDADTNDLDFALEYAIELHRKGNFSEAIVLYEKYLASVNPVENYYRINIWLSECYINIGNTEKYVSNWQKCNFIRHHASIDFAIYSVHGEANFIRKRDNLRREIKKGNHNFFYELIYNDVNWQIDWWNTAINESFLTEDMLLLQNTISKTTSIYKTIYAYVEIKKLNKTVDPTSAIEAVLKNNKLILVSDPLPIHGGMASDLLRICFNAHLLNENEFYTKRGNELLSLATKNNDSEFLNIYAYLQGTVTGKVDESIDKRGWTEFKDERFAMSYFIGKADKNSLDDPDLVQALIDFPNSAKIHWIQTNCAVIEKRNIKTVLIELIKLEFKTLGSDRNRYSSSLNKYINYLETLK